jgi:hypothetical protein
MQRTVRSSRCCRRIACRRIVVVSSYRGRIIGFRVAAYVAAAARLSLLIVRCSGPCAAVDAVVVLLVIVSSYRGRIISFRVAAYVAAAARLSLLIVPSTTAPVGGKPGAPNLRSSVQSR